MSSSHPADNSPAIQLRLLQRYNDHGRLSFHEFMRIALYEPELGYYVRKDRARVGKTRTHDFATATLLGDLWGELLKEALQNLLSPDSPEEYTLVEIGVEPNGSPLARLDPSPFRGVETRTIGEPLQLPAKAVIFFNEVLDAQPFHRVRFTPGGWLEATAVPTENGLWQWHWEKPSGPLLPILKSIADPLPGQIIDLPLAACEWLQSLLNEPWQGILLTADYGKTWHELVHEFPEGTGRAFYQQKVHNDLLARPGDQDLTCDPCWDWIEHTLQKHGCTEIQRQRLEAFWMQHARTTLERVFLEGNMQQRSILKELLHPSFYGMRFEAVAARKP